MFNKENVFEINDITIKNNQLQFNIETNKETLCDIFLNDNKIDTINIETTKHLKYSLVGIFGKNLKLKIITEDLIIEKNIHRTIDSFFEGLKRTMLGKNESFFLVNDTNQEINLHYNKDFSPKLDIERYKQSTNSKKNYLNKNNITYHQFVIPDKSIVLREYLPFETSTPYSNIEFLKDEVYYLNDIIEVEDYLKNDTHVSPKSSFKIVPYIISVINNTSPELCKEQLLSKIQTKIITKEGDLFNYRNWSYNRDELYYKNKCIEIEDIKLKNEYEKVEISQIPKQFRRNGNRNSLYCKNPNSISDKKAVILHGSSVLNLIDSFVAFYKEVFFYWDHHYFNKDLINWFKPDDVIELRIERVIDNPIYDIINDSYEPDYPKELELKDFKIKNDNLSAQILLKDYRSLPVNADLDIYLNDKLILSDKIENGSYNLNYSLENIAYDTYTLKIEANIENECIKTITKEFNYFESLDVIFKDLNKVYRGLNDHFFLVNENTNEIKQHYDKTFKSTFDLEKFKLFFKSKKLYIESLGIDYNLAILPDRSIILKDYLPFEMEPIRNIDLIQEDIIDLTSLISEEDYLVNDIDIKDESTIKISAFLISEIFGYNVKDCKNEINKRTILKDINKKGNLALDKLWSYDRALQEKYMFINTKKVELKDNFETISNEQIPEEFSIFSSSKSLYFKNNNAFINKKILVLLDNVATPLINTLIASFKEVFFYYDFWYFNKELVEWYKPDAIIEIRGEKNLENFVYQLVSIKENIIIPIIIKKDSFEIENNNIHLEINCIDNKQLPLNTKCNILLDNNQLANTEMINGSLIFNYDLKDVKPGKHKLTIIIEKTRTTKSRIINKTFEN